jgi:hypothetical protein
MPLSPRLRRPILSGDPDANRYIAAVQAADGNTLELAVRKAITDFVVGCKQDGIWTPIKACCLLMGPRTLAGALTPLVGAAPTNNGPFVSGDYNRETGLLGDGVGKYLDSNRNNNADPQDSFHASAYVSAAAVDTPGTGTTPYAYFGAGGTTSGTCIAAWSGAAGGTVTFRSRNSGSFTSASDGSVTGLVATNRAESSGYTTRFGGTNTSRTQASQAAFNGNILVFARNDGSNVAGLFSNARMAFYSIGESVDLALLDTRVTTLYNAIAAAI